MDSSPDPADTVALTGTVVGGRIDLPSGGWVEYGDPGRLRAKDKKRVLGNITNIDRQIAASLDMIDGVIAMLVDKWELPYLPNAPLPREMPEILGELTIADSDALTAAAQPALQVLFPGTKKTQPGDPDSPTGPASA